jgi:hypothetical protein
MGENWLNRAVFPTSHKITSPTHEPNPTESHTEFYGLWAAGVAGLREVDHDLSWAAATEGTE